MNRILFLILFFTKFVLGNVNFEQNGYSGIVVAISPDIPSTRAAEIIDNIKLMIRQASPVLYRATYQGAYFKQVSILIPESWDTIVANTSTSETYETAEIKVASPNGAYGDTPYTLQIRGCGEPGEFIHFTPNYLLDLNKPENIVKYGPPGKVFVHEWSHLRYGVFDEHGIPGDPNYPLFYSSFSGRQLPNVCANEQISFDTKDITTNGPCQTDPVTGLYDANCRFVFDAEFKPMTSLMSYHHLDSVVEFCDEGQVNSHNIQAPNKHNTMCDRKSVWAVISKHADFVSNNPATNLSNLEPSFQIIRSVNPRYVLVADVSGSMKEHKRSTRLQEAARRWIRHDLPTGSRLGIVQFNEIATTLSNLETITDVQSRIRLMDLVPNYPRGNTCIGCGLRKALMVLQPTGGGGVILLITDGEHNTGETIAQVLPDLIRAKIRVVTIAIGKDADQNIEQLADLTGGKSYFIPDTDTSNNLNGAFTGSLTYQPAVSTEHLLVKLFEREYQADGGDVNGLFTVDFTIGKNLLFRVDYTGSTSIDNLLLISPTGDHYDNLDDDFTSKVAYIMIDSATVGEWQFVASVRGNPGDTFIVRIVSQKNVNVTAPITTRCWVDNGADIQNAAITPIKLFAEVKQGNNPVIGVTVK